MLGAGTYTDCHLKKLSVVEGIDAARGADTDITPHVKAKLTISHTFRGNNEKHTQMLIAQIPEISKAVGELRKIGSKDDVAEGPNTFELRARRTFAAMHYMFSIPGFPVIEFNGDVDGKPVVKVVDGIVAIDWKLEFRVEAQAMATLGYMTDRKDLEVTIGTLQKSLDLVDVSSVEAVEEQPDA